MFEESEELAEIIGIVLGDGNIHEFVRPGKGVATRVIRITGDAKDDREYYHNTIIPLCERVFGYTPKIYFHKTNRGIIACMFGKRFVDFFKEQGIPPGNKIKNQVGIPDWIFKKDAYRKAVVRGLMDTDGSIYRMGKWVQMSFKNNNPRLLVGFRDTLLGLGYFVSRISKNQVYISRKNDIQKFYKEIGFHNPKHRNRYVRFLAP